jgi:hypothetical protein
MLPRTRLWCAPAGTILRSCPGSCSLRAIGWLGEFNWCNSSGHSVAACGGSCPALMDYLDEIARGGRGAVHLWEVGPTCTVTSEFSSAGLLTVPRRGDLDSAVRALHVRHLGVDRRSSLTATPKGADHSLLGRRTRRNPLPSRLWPQEPDSSETGAVRHVPRMEPARYWPESGAARLGGLLPVWCRDIPSPGPHLRTYCLVESTSPLGWQVLSPTDTTNNNRRRVGIGFFQWVAGH